MTHGGVHAPRILSASAGLPSSLPGIADGVELHHGDTVSCCDDQGVNAGVQSIRAGGHGGYCAPLREELPSASSWTTEVLEAKPSGSVGSAVSSKERESQPGLQASLFPFSFFFVLVGLP